MPTLLIVGSGVPVPDIGPMPGTYENTPVVYGLGAVAIIGVLLFLAQSLVVSKRARAGGNLLIPFIVTTALMLVPMGAVYVLIATGKTAAYDRIDAWLHRDDEVLATVKPQLEKYYGITIHDRIAIPVAGQLNYKSEITLPDGTTAKCLIIADKTYKIACGEGYDLATLQTLPPADGAGS